MISLTWRPRLGAAETAEVLALVEAVTEVDGTAPVSEHVLLHLHRGGDVAAEHLLVRDEDVPGVLLGYAHLDTTDRVAGSSGELAVHAEYRHRGVGSQMVAALLHRISAPGAPIDGRLRLWAHGEHPGAVALARHFGFRRVRVLWQMRRSLLAALPAPELPDGVTLRAFRVGADEQAFVEVNNRAFAWHRERAGWDVAQLKLRQGEPWFDPDGFLLAVDDNDRLLGFHWTKVHGGGSANGHPHEPIGEVYVVGVDPAAQGRRLGTALTLAGLRHLRAKGLRQVMLYVEADNAAAIGVYQRLDFIRWDTDVSYLR